MAQALPILIDGSLGEGSGQLLRTALALSAVTGRPFAISRLRAGQQPPGLREDQLAVVRAAASLCDALLEGDAVGSERLSFAPRRQVVAGDRTFDLPGAGSVTLLLQALCWPLALAGAASTLTLRGGTHLAGGPSFHELALVWVPAMARLGFTFELGLQAAGFAPEGGGACTVRIEPAHAMPPLDLRQRGLLQSVEVLALVAGLPWADAVAEAAHAERGLRALGVPAETERIAMPAQGSRGRQTLLVASFERVRSGHASIRAGARAGEGAAAEAVASLQAHLERGGAVDPYLADQLLLPAALLAARLVAPATGMEPVTRFTTSARTPHLEGTAAVIQRFLDVEVSLVGHLGEEIEVRVEPPGGGAGILPLPQR
jgi:RNA 3'-terminal phosphate cyclase (ATP)